LKYTLTHTIFLCCTAVQLLSIPTEFFI